MRRANQAVTLAALLLVVYGTTAAAQEQVPATDAAPAAAPAPAADPVIEPAAPVDAPAADPVSLPAMEYRLLATNRTSTMEGELNEAAAEGFRVDGMIGGETAFGGKEIVAIVRRSAETPPEPRYAYRVLATNRTSTMEREMQAAGGEGYVFRAQTVLETMFGGREVVVVMEKDLHAPEQAYDYLLLATQRTSTMEDELEDAGREGYVFAGVTVGETFAGGNEVVVIASRPRPAAEVAPSGG